MPGGKRESRQVPAESAAQRYAVTIRTVPAEHHLGRPVRGRAGKPQGHHAPHCPAPAPSPADAESHRCPPPQQTVVACPGQARQNRVEERTRTGKAGEDGPVHGGNGGNQQPCPINDQCSSDGETPRMADRVTRSRHAVTSGRHVRSARQVVRPRGVGRAVWWRVTTAAAAVLTRLGSPRRGSMILPVGKISPVSSNKITPLHSRLHPWSQCRIVTRAASRSGPAAGGQGGE